MSKRALITGITGQDGAYLAKLLLDKDYTVYGSYRRSSTPNFWRLQYLDVHNRVHLLTAELNDSSSLIDTIRVSRPDEIYHLAAQSFPGASFEHPVGYGEITGLGLTRLLEAVRSINKDIRVYQASTIELFGQGNTKPLTEDTPFNPANPYAVAKLYAHWIANIYRAGYGIFICNGIMFNHESPLRGLDFVTRKISNAVARISLGLDNELAMGNIEAKRDWGYAPEYVNAMWRMLQQKEPDDYIIATNEMHTVKQFLQQAFSIVGLDWSKYVKVNKELLRPVDVNFWQGDYARAKTKLGWQPEVKFERLVEIMVHEDVKRWESWLKGVALPWDGYNYISK
ncbi:MAG: GDP-mannose 4,6-dehydratase [Dehalococcoidia bacterium]|nr:GDP-mannose 4,6-dehydratase [Dehalococcoidia bacterium]MDD5493137.1 GDP-mannose 4,6-dehydratase [Dehalococcoidia bacterium]